MNAIADKFPHVMGGDPVSDLQVMQSAAGYYVGRSYWDTEFGFEGPYSRESGYFATEVEAQTALEHGYAERDCVENAWAQADRDHDEFGQYCVAVYERGEDEPNEEYERWYKEKYS